MQINKSQESKKTRGKTLIKYHVPLKTQHSSFLFKANFSRPIYASNHICPPFIVLSLFIQKHSHFFFFFFFFLVRGPTQHKRNQNKLTLVFDIITKMAQSDHHHYSRQSLMPSFLYSSSSLSSSKRLFDLDALMNNTNARLLNRSALFVSPSSNGVSKTESFVIPAPKEKIEMYSPAFYAACTAGGMLSCGLTHMALTPLDLVKCNMQVLPF